MCARRPAIAPPSRAGRAEVAMATTHVSPRSDPDHDELVGRLAELQVSRLLADGSPFAVVVDRVAHLARAAVPGVDEVSLP